MRLIAIYVSCFLEKQSITSRAIIDQAVTFNHDTIVLFFIPNQLDRILDECSHKLPRSTDNSEGRYLSTEA